MFCGSVNIGGRSKLRRGDWTWFSFSMTLANCNHWREIDYQMMMTQINNFYSIDVLYFEFNKKIYIYVNGLGLYDYISIFSSMQTYLEHHQTWSFFWSSEEKTATIEEILYLKWHEKSKMEYLVCTFQTKIIIHCIIRQT